MELTRKQVIEILEKADDTVYKEPKTKTAQALEYAINSLKTDEAYQLMYEGEEIFTKADIVTILEELKAEIEKMSCLYIDFVHYVNEYDVSNLVQQKINSIEEE